MAEIKDAIEPATVSETGRAPKNRFSTVAGLQSAYKNAKRGDVRVDARLADIASIYDGDPPALEKEDEARLQGFPNINRREFKAKIHTYAGTWTDIDSGGERLVEVKTKAHGKETQQEVSTYSRQLTQFTNEAITEWSGEECRSLCDYLFESTVRNIQMGIYGIGPIYFPDSLDWRFMSIPNRSVTVPHKTKVTLSNCTILWIDREFTVTQLYTLSRSKRDGWNKEQITDLLWKKTAQQDTKENIADWQARVADNDDFLQDDFSPVNLVEAYVQEFNENADADSISHYIFAESTGEKPLFFKDREYQRFGQILIAFCDNPGKEGTWHSVKGFGDDIYDLCHSSNFIWNAVSRAALMAMFPMFQSSSDSDRQKLAQMTWTAFGIVAPDVQISEIKLRPDISGGMAILNENGRVMDTNTRIFPQNDSGPKGEAPTATQVAFDRQDQATFTSLQVKVFRMGGLDRQFFEMYRRLSRPESEYPEAAPGGKAAANFRKKCKDAGIPDKCRTDVEYVRASRTGGSGNMGLDSMKADQVLNIASPGAGQLNARKEKAAVLYGWDRVDEFVEGEIVLTEQDRIVTYDNSFLSDGKIIPAFPSDDHEKHLGTPDGGAHLALLASAQQQAMQLQQQGLETAIEDAVKIDKILEAAIAHCQSHHEFMAEMPRYKESVKQIGALLDQFSRFAQVFTQEVGAAVQAQQPQGPQMSAEDQRKMMTTQIEIEIKKAFAAQELEARQKADDLKLGHIATRAAFKQEAEEQKFNQKQGQEAEQVLIDQFREKVELEKELAKTRAKGNIDKVSNGQGSTPSNS